MKNLLEAPKSRPFFKPIIEFDFLKSLLYFLKYSGDSVEIVKRKMCKVIFLSVKMLARIFWSLTALKKSSKDLLPAKYLDWNVTVFSVSQSVCVQRSNSPNVPSRRLTLTPQEFQWIFSACKTTVWTKGKSWEKTDSSDTKFKIYALDGALPDF